MLSGMRFITKKQGKINEFEPVDITLTFLSFEDLQLFYKMMDRYKSDFIPKGASGWTSWFDLYAFVKNYLIESLLI